MKKVQPITFIRLNSERLPNKSISMIGDNPLASYSLKSLKGVKGIEEPIVFSSEDYLRPFNLDYAYIKREKSLDGNVSFNDIMKSALDHIDSEYILYFCVTSPFIKASTIQNMVDKINFENFDSSFTAIKIRNFCWFKGEPLNYKLTENIPFTQDLNPVFQETSGMYIFETSLFKETGRRIGFNPFIQEVSHFEGHDIDYPDDLKLAESYVRIGVV